MKQLSIIVVNYNGWNDTKECLASLVNITSTLAEITVIVVDNKSNLSIKEKIKKVKDSHSDLSLHFIQNDTNLGFGGGNNVGISYAVDHDADYIFLLNNDTVVDSHFVDPLITYFETNEKAGIIGPKIYFERGYEFHKDRYTESEKGNVIWFAGGIIDWDNIFASHRGVDEVDIGRYNHPAQTQFITGCGMCIKREVITSIGLLDERYFMYLEDVDYCMRAERNGFELWYVPASKIWHKNAQSTGNSGSDLHVYYQTRNRLIFAMKYASLRTKLAVLRNSLHVLKTREKRRSAVVDFYLGRSGMKKDLHQ
jgi:hypothetical protein